MSVQAITAVLELSGLTTNEKFVLVLLANYADQEMRSWYSQAAIAEHMCAGERTVRRALAQLEKRGLIRREKRVGKAGLRPSNMVWITLPKPPAILAAGIPSPPANLAATARPNMSPPPAILAGEPSLTIKEPSARGTPPAAPRAAAPALGEKTAPTPVRDPAERAAVAAGMRALAAEMEGRSNA